MHNALKNNVTVGILIPCHNEERTIRACVLACLGQTHPPDNIVVVNDGSTDRSAEILAAFSNQVTVVHTPKQTGNKSRAQQFGLPYITQDILITTDSDSFLDPHYIEQVLPHFADPQVGAVGGYVKSIAHNYYTAYREFDYFIGQEIHKRAQAHIGFILVIPGCAGAFRTDVFKQKITFDHDTLTEDLDFTYKLHELGYHVHFADSAIVYTQDPATLFDYMNQMRRWYAGGWQNLRKHIAVLQLPRCAFELSLIYVEGLLFSGLIMFYLLLSTVSFFKNMLIMTVIFWCVGLICAVVRKRLDIFIYSPFFMPLIFLNTYLFIEQFVKEIILQKHAIQWFKPSRWGV